MIKFLLSLDEVASVADDPDADRHNQLREMAFTAQHWADQAHRCANQAEGLRRVAVELGLGRYSMNERGEREFRFNYDDRNL